MPSSFRWIYIYIYIYLYIYNVGCEFYFYLKFEFLKFQFDFYSIQFEFASMSCNTYFKSNLNKYSFDVNCNAFEGDYDLGYRRASYPITSNCKDFLYLKVMFTHIKMLVPRRGISHLRL